MAKQEIYLRNFVVFKVSASFKYLKCSFFNPLSNPVKQKKHSCKMNSKRCNIRYFLQIPVALAREMAITSSFFRLSVSFKSSKCSIWYPLSMCVMKKNHTSQTFSEHVSKRRYSICFLGIVTEIAIMLLFFDLQKVLKAQNVSFLTIFPTLSIRI